MIRFVRAGAFCVMKYAARHIIKCHWLAAEIGCICSLARLIDGKYEFRCLNSVEIIRKERKKNQANLFHLVLNWKQNSKAKYILIGFLYTCPIKQC